jgi:tryptophan-rich sensory protein
MKLILSLLLPQLAGVIGSFFTVSAIPSWYANLNKPAFAPPNWIFAPAWLTLYLLMGIALYLNWIKKSQQAKSNVRLFFVHLFLNAIWSPVFFGARNPFLALIIIALIWFTIVVMIVNFWRVNKTSSVLLIPYLFWVSFASALNYFIWKLN